MHEEIIFSCTGKFKVMSQFCKVFEVFQFRFDVPSYGTQNAKQAFELTHPPFPLTENWTKKYKRLFYSPHRTPHCACHHSTFHWPVWLCPRGGSGTRSKPVSPTWSCAQCSTELFLKDTRDCRSYFKHYTVIYPNILSLFNI